MDPLPQSALALEQLFMGAGQLVTSRGPADLPAFCAAVVEQFARAHRPMPS
ncbi:hypothetical protein [Streptomyces sp. 900105755]